MLRRPGALSRIPKSVYNPVPSRLGTGSLAIPLTTLAEDAVHRDSIHSYLLQLADVNAYFLHQRVQALRVHQEEGATAYFNRLDPVLCKVASALDPQGIVWL